VSPLAVAEAESTTAGLHLHARGRNTNGANGKLSKSRWAVQPVLFSVTVPRVEPATFVPTCLRVTCGAAALDGYGDGDPTADSIVDPDETVIFTVTSGTDTRWLSLVGTEL